MKVEKCPACNFVMNTYLLGLYTYPIHYPWCAYRKRNFEYNNIYETKDDK